MNDKTIAVQPKTGRDCGHFHTTDRSADRCGFRTFGEGCYSLRGQRRHLALVRERQARE